MHAAGQFPGGARLDGCLSKLLAYAARSGARPKRLLADRGFFSADCTGVAGRTGRARIVPAPKNERVKRRTREHSEGKLPQASEYAMRNASGKSEAFTLIMVKKAEEKDGGGEGGEGGDAVSKYAAFVTSMPVEKAEETIEPVPE